jgi:hypothetical protein
MTPAGVSQERRGRPAQGGEAGRATPAPDERNRPQARGVLRGELDERVAAEG